MCAGLWCLTEGEEFCKTKLDAPLEGTECGTDKVSPGRVVTPIPDGLGGASSHCSVFVPQWCRAGECVSKSYLPQHVDGDWSLWSPWSVCSRTCGTAVRFRQRKCDNPPYVSLCVHPHRLRKHFTHPFSQVRFRVQGSIPRGCYKLNPVWVSQHPSHSSLNYVATRGQSQGLPEPAPRLCLPKHLC